MSRSRCALPEAGQGHGQGKGRGPSRSQESRNGKHIKKISLHIYPAGAAGSDQVS
jgi:hypothetical protein